MTDETASDEVVARLHVVPRPHRGLFWWLVVVLLVGFAVVQVEQFALNQQVKNANCRTTLFLRDTDRYIVEHTAHPDDPKVVGFRQFLAHEENKSCG